jgi:hypothetical protein
VGISIQHLYNFESSGAGCFDGGNLKYSVNASALAVLDLGDYVGAISSSFSNPMAGQDAWCGGSGGSIVSSASGTITPGDTYQFAFDAAWDSSVSGTLPDWDISSVDLRGFELASVPEPATLALLGIGLLGLGLGRRKLT